MNSVQNTNSNMVQETATKAVAKRWCIMESQSEKQSKNNEISDLLNKVHQGNVPTHKKKPQQGIEPRKYQKQLMDAVKQALQAYDELVAERGTHDRSVLRFKNGVDMVRSIAHVVERKQSLPTDTQLTAGTLVPFIPKEDQRPQITHLRVRHAIIKREADLVAELDGCYELDSSWAYYHECTFDVFVSSLKKQHRMFLKFRNGQDLLDWQETVNGSCDRDDKGNGIEGVGRWRRKTRFINGKKVDEVVAVETKDGKPIDQAA